MISSALDYTKASSLSLFTEVGLPFFFVFFSSEDFLENRKPENLLIGLGIDTTRKFFKNNKYLEPIKENILNNFSKSKILKKITKRVANLGLN